MNSPALNDILASKLVNSIISNDICASQRKVFNLCRTTSLGKVIEPQYCAKDAIELIDCHKKA